MLMVDGNVSLKCTSNIWNQIHDKNKRKEDETDKYLIKHCRKKMKMLKIQQHYTIASKKGDYKLKWVDKSINGYNCVKSLS